VTSVTLSNPAVTLYTTRSHIKKICALPAVYFHVWLGSQSEPTVLIFLYFVNGLVFRYVHKIAKSDYELRRVCPSVRQSVRREQHGSHWIDLHEIW